MFLPLIFWAVVASAVSFTLYALDKRSAVKGRQRIPESTLLTVDALLGYPGGFLAQRVLRHKGRKRSYQLRFWLVVALHVGVYIFLTARAFLA